MIYFVAALAISLAIGVKPAHSQTGENTQWLVLYEDKDFKGRTLAVTSTSGVDKYCEDVVVCSGDPTLNNAFSSAKLTGVWLFYDQVDYGEGGPGVEAHWGQDVGFNFNTVNDLISSFKYVGSWEDWRKDTLTLYPYEFFRGSGEEFFSTGDNVMFLGTQRSVIVTGITPWTIYSDRFFEGDSVCLYPDNENEWPGYITDLQTEGIYRVGSVYPGCSPSAKRSIIMRSFSSGTP